MVPFTILERICYLWFATKLDVPHHKEPGDRRSFLRLLKVLKADLEAITGQSAREEERSAAKPEVAGAFVDRPAAARVDEDLDYKIAQRKGSVEGWRSFLAAHGSGTSMPQSAKAEVEKLLLAGQDPAPAAAEVSEWLAHRRENWEPGRGLGPA